jgi:hypothetical protein
MDNQTPKEPDKVQETETSNYINQLNDISTQQQNFLAPTQVRFNKYRYELEDAGPFRVLCKSKSKDGNTKVDDTLVAKLFKKQKFNPISIVISSNDTIIVTLNTSKEANDATENVEINGKIDCYIPKHFVLSNGLIDNIDLGHEIEELKAEIKASNTGIHDVKRLLSKDKKPLPRIHVTFRGQKIPNKINIYGRAREVKNFPQDPKLCFKCGRFGHDKDHCKSKKEVCKTCFEVHQGLCTLTGCKNCKSKLHVWTNPSCPAYQKEQKTIDKQVKENIGRRDARDAVNKTWKQKQNVLNEQEFPYLPSATSDPAHHQGTSKATIERDRKSQQELNGKYLKNLKFNDLFSHKENANKSYSISILKLKNLLINKLTIGYISVLDKFALKESLKTRMKKVSIKSVNEFFDNHENLKDLKALIDDDTTTMIQKNTAQKRLQAIRNEGPSGDFADSTLNKLLDNYETQAAAIDFKSSLAELSKIKDSEMVFLQDEEKMSDEDILAEFSEETMNVDPSKVTLTGKIGDTVDDVNKNE